MKKSTTPTFITEIPLKTSSLERSVLQKRFWAAKQQYNALLGEALKRLTKLRKDKRYKEAIALYKSEKKSEAKAIFKQLNEDYAYSEYSLYAYTKRWNKKRNFLSIGARISQQLAKRAFQATEEYRIGKRGKPRFKGYRGLSSIEDNSVDANLRLRENTLYYLGLELPLKINLRDPIHYHGIHSKKKYVRIVKRNFNSRIRYFAQLACEGTPWVKSTNPSPNHIVGLDIGPQTLAIVSPTKNHAQLQVLADEIKPLKLLKKQIQRKINRKLRANNPSSFQKDQWEKKDKHWQRKKGKSIKNVKCTMRSKSLLKQQAKLADIARKEAAFRKTKHNQLVNHILRIGNEIKTEKISYKAFQKLYGSSVGLRAPGMFVERLKRKAENAGGKVEEINTWKTRLSQTCHCGTVKKKKLSERWHECNCGVKAQRDLYSAYLASFVEKDKLIADQAQKAWSGMDIALCMAMEKVKQSISGHQPASLGLSRVRDCHA